MRLDYVTFNVPTSVGRRHFVLEIVEASTPLTAPAPADATMPQELVNGSFEE